MNFIDPAYFFAALFVGFFVTYILMPKPDVIIKYPTPGNAGKIVYKDKNDVCYKYSANKVDCSPSSVDDPKTLETSTT